VFINNLLSTHSSSIFYLQNRWKCASSFKPRPLYFRETRFGHSTARSLCGTQNRLDAIENRQIFPLKEIEPWCSTFSPSLYLLSYRGSACIWKGWENHKMPQNKLLLSDKVEYNFVGYYEIEELSLWSSGLSSWLRNEDVLCFLWGTNWIYICM
jgi:hypothetical protein